MESVDAVDSKSSSARSAGSIPARRIEPFVSLPTFWSAAIKAKFGAMPHELSVADQTRAAIWEMKNKYPTTWRALQGDNGADMIGALVDDYERPGNRGRAKAQRMGYLP